MFMYLILYRYIVVCVSFTPGYVTCQMANVKKERPKLYLPWRKWFITLAREALLIKGITILNKHQLIVYSFIKVTDGGSTWQYRFLV